MSTEEIYMYIAEPSMAMCLLFGIYAMFLLRDDEDEPKDRHHRG